MYRLLLLSFLALCIKASNIDYYSGLQNKLERLSVEVSNLGKEIQNFFTEDGDSADWYERNKAKHDNEIKLFNELQENVTSTKDILSYTEAFLEGTSATDLSLQREERRTGVIKDELARQAIHAGNSSSELNGVRDRLAHALSQQALADEGMNEAQVRLLGMRRNLDELIKREGEVDFRLNELHNKLISRKVRAEAVFLGEKQAKEDVEKAERRTKVIEEAINQARNELQTLKTRSEEPSTDISSVSSMNYIKSVKTASKKGKKMIKIDLISD